MNLLELQVLLVISRIPERRTGPSLLQFENVTSTTDVSRTATDEPRTSNDERRTTNDEPRTTNVEPRTTNVAGAP